MINDTTFPLGYYIEVLTDYMTYKGHLAAYDDQYLVIDSMPSDDARTRVPPGTRYWVQRSRVYHTAISPSSPQPQNREGEAEPARVDRWNAVFDRLAGARPNLNA